MHSSKSLKIVRKFSNAAVEESYSNHLISEKRSGFHCFPIGMGICAFFQILTHLLWWTDTSFHAESQRLIGLIWPYLIIYINASVIIFIISIGADNKEKDDSQHSLFVAVVMGMCSLGVLVVVLLLQNKKLISSPICPPVVVLIWTAMILVKFY